MKDLHDSLRACVSLDASSGTTLTEQFVLSVKAAIRAGNLRAGEILPPVKDWADALGCSAFVPRRAMGLLAKEGVLTIKRHVGAIVTGRLAPERKKLVIYVTRDNGDIWSRNVFAFRLGEILRKAGFRFEHVRINRRSAAGSRRGFPESPLRRHESPLFCPGSCRRAICATGGFLV